ncbi:MAG: ABC transporter permease, partial [bacterium]
MKKRNLLLTLGLSLTGALFLLSLLSAFWTPFDPEALSGAEKLLGPSLRHLAGTDQFGRDIFSRILKGLGNTFSIALITNLLGGGVGILIGLITGY